LLKNVILNFSVSLDKQKQALEFVYSRNQRLICNMRN